MNCPAQSIDHILSNMKGRIVAQNLTLYKLIFKILVLPSELTTVLLTFFGMGLRFCRKVWAELIKEILQDGFKPHAIDLLDDGLVNKS